MLKKIIVYFLSKFGIGIYRISTDNQDSEIPNAQGLEIIDPIHHNSLKRINEFYSDPEVVDQYIDLGRISFYNEVINLLIGKGVTFEHKNIADIGCGTGHLLKFVGEKFEPSNIVGLEYSDSAINIAKIVCPKATFFQFDIYQDFSQQFDVLLCTEVLEHLVFPDKALETCLKIIANEGTLLITVPDGRKDTFLGHINFWSPESWKIFIETNCNEFQLDIGIFGNDTNYAIIKRKK